jgi:hypothetical protein
MSPEPLYIVRLDDTVSLSEDTSNTFYNSFLTIVSTSTECVSVGDNVFLHTPSMRMISFIVGSYDPDGE